MRNGSTKGFTLIELLIVIAIIGILAAVLIPNLLNARERAFDTSAQACANSIATGMEIAKIDNPNDDYPNLSAIAADGSTTPALEGTNQCSGIAFVSGDADATSVTKLLCTIRRATSTDKISQNGLEQKPGSQ